MRKLVAACLVSTAALAMSAMLALPAGAQALPPPADFVNNLDLACYIIPCQPPANVPLRLDHLNPLFQSLQLPYENVVLENPQDLCVPVYKNGVQPPADALPFIQWLDWKCYCISGPPLNQKLRLTNLNPAVAAQVGSTVDVTVLDPVQLCVPVLKSFTSTPPQPPASVLHLIQYLDVKCYNVSAPPVSKPLTINHLNPLFATRPAENVTINDPQRLCVPVEKNQQPVPSDVLPIIQLSDVLCYDLGAKPLNQNLSLFHLNPVLTGMGLPVEQVRVTKSDVLCTPVSKALQPGS